MRTSRISATVGLILILGCSENSPQSFTSSPYAPIDSATAASALAGAARLCGADGADDAQSAQLLFGHLSADGDRLNDQEVAQAQLILAGLAQSPATAELNWQEWIEACDRKQPTLASLYLEAASRSQGSASSNIAKHFDLRRTSDQLRLQVQKVLWAYSPSFDGFNSTRKLFFKEKPRANSPLRLNIISQVLAHNFSPQSEELLLQVVERSNFGDFERRTAVRALAERNSKLAIPIFDMIFRSEARNALLRKEALLGLLKLDQDFAIQLIYQTETDPLADPVISGFLEKLREQYPKS